MPAVGGTGVGAGGGIGQPLGIGALAFSLGLVVQPPAQFTFSDPPPGVGVPEIWVIDDPPLPQQSPPIAHIVGGGDWQGQPVPAWLSTVLQAWQAPDPQPPYVQTKPPVAIFGGSDWRPVGLPRWLSETVAIWQPPDPQLPYIQVRSHLFLLAQTSRRLVAFQSLRK